LRNPETGLVFQERWEVEQYARSFAATKGVQGGVKFDTRFDNVKVKCNNCASFTMVFNYKPSSGQWILNKYEIHEDGCFGAPTPADGASSSETMQACKSAFTAKQVARVIVQSDLDLNLPMIQNICSSYYRRCPGLRFFRHVKAAAVASMVVDRAVDMAALPFFAEALSHCGHKVTPLLLPPIIV
jgi:hypothetical protein